MEVADAVMMKFKQGVDVEERVEPIDHGRSLLQDVIRRRWDD